MGKNSSCKGSLVVLIVPRGDFMGCIHAANVRIAGIHVVNQRVADTIKVAEIGVDDTGVEDTRTSDVRAGDMGVIIDNFATMGIVAISGARIGIVDMVVATIGRVGTSKIGIHSATNKWNIIIESSCYKRSLVVFIVPRGDSMGCICAANQRIAGIRFVSQGVADIKVAEIWVDDAGVNDTGAGDIGVAIVADVAIIGIVA